MLTTPVILGGLIDRSAPCRCVRVVTAGGTPSMPPAPGKRHPVTRAPHRTAHRADTGGGDATVVVMTARTPRLALATLPPAARAIATAVSDAVAAAQAGDAVAFEESSRRLSPVDPEYVRTFLGGVSRSMLEDLHPHGVGGDDLHDLIGRCVRSASTWLPGVDPGVLVLVLGGALGVHEDVQPAVGADGDGNLPVEFAPDQAPARPVAADVTRHALVLLAHLVSTLGRPLRGYLEASFTEIAREETVELP